VQRIVAVLVAELEIQDVDWVSPVADDRWLVQRDKLGQLVLLDATLRPVWSLEIGLDTAGKHAIADDASLVALSMRDRVVLLDGGAKHITTFPHHPWDNAGGESGCCAIARDGRDVWATVPASSPEQRHAPNDELWLIDVARRAIIDRRSLDTAMAGCEAILHPDGETVGLSIGEGQDRAVTCWAKRARDGIDLRTARFDDRILVDIHPGGSEYLTTPHGSCEEYASTRHSEQHAVVDVRSQVLAPAVRRSCVDVS